MIDPNLGFDPNAPGVQKVTNKKYSERYSYGIDPYVYGKIGGSIRELMLRQFQRISEIEHKINERVGFDIKVDVKPTDDLNRFSWDLNFEAKMTGERDCSFWPIRYIDKYFYGGKGWLMILTDNELAKRVETALAVVYGCIEQSKMEEKEEEERRRLRTGRPLDRGPRRDRPGGQNCLTSSHPRGI